MITRKPQIERQKKAKKVYIGPSHRQAWGNEPTWEDIKAEEIEQKLAFALNWYSANSTPDQHKAWALSYFDNSNLESPTEARALRQIREVEFHLCGILARIMSRGCKLPARTNAGFLAARDRLLSGRGVAKIAERKPKVVKPPKPKPVQVRDPAVTAVCGSLDGLLDDVCTGKIKKVPDAKDWGGDKLEPKLLKQVQQKFQHETEEVRLALTGEDPEIAEAYATYGPIKLKRLFDFLQKIQSAVSLVVPVAKNMTPAQLRREQERVTKKAAKSLQRTISKVLYKACDQDLGLNSIDPHEIPGSQMLWFYSTKTNRLGVYFSLNPTGLGVHRTTITDYDESTSIQKKVPKNKVNPLLVEFMAKTKVQVEKWFKQLKTTGKPVNCRLNRDTILLKVYK